MHEWLSGGVSPCQGEGRGFESRLVLSWNKRMDIRLDIHSFIFESNPGLESSNVSAPLRSVQGRCPLEIVHHLVLNKLEEKT